MAIPGVADIVGKTRAIACVPGAENTCAYPWRVLTENRLGRLAILPTCRRDTILRERKAMASRFRRRGKKEEQLNMAPLIDMIFILLIFFLVTTSFIKESGVVIKQPVPSDKVSKEKKTMFIQVDRDGVIFIENKSIDIQLVRAYMERYQVENPQNSVVIVGHRESRIGVVIRVLDTCKLAGIKNVSVAPSKE